MRSWCALVALCSCTSGGGKDADGASSDWGATDCTWTPAAAAEVAVREECRGREPTTVEDPWNIAPEWDYTDPEGTGVLSMPAIGNMTDDNGDGVVNLLDTPDIAFVTRAYNLVLVDGATGEVIWERDAYNQYGGVVLADVDSDGANEVVALNMSLEIDAIDGDGEVEWTSDPFSPRDYPQPIVADLDGDGVPEVIVDQLVLSGDDGDTLFALDAPTGRYASPVAADLDLDGRMEILLGDDVFDATGALLWTGAVGSRFSMAAVLNVDDDDEAEVLMVNDSGGRIYEHDGALKTELSGLAGLSTDLPCVADLDGDGAPEIGVPVEDAMVVLEPDGEVLWQYPTTDVSGLAGCSAFDFDEDGASELLYGDEEDFYIFDGRTGEVLFHDPDHAAVTIWEYPVVADVDADGSAEVVVSVSGGFSGGLRVYGQVDNRWPSAGPGWPTHDYGGANVLSDGTVIAHPTPSWLGDNLFRGRPPTEDWSRADLSVEITDVCVTSCPSGELVVGVQVANEGAADAPAGVQLTIYAVTGGERLAVQTITLDEAIPVGAAAEGASFTVAPSYFGPEGFFVRVDDDGAGHTSTQDCDRSNNEVSYAEPVCGTY